MKRSLLVLLAAGVLAGCSEDPLGPERRVQSTPNIGAMTQQSDDARNEAVADVLDRIAPALGDSPAAANARAALKALEAHLQRADAAAVGGDLATIATALDRLERFDPTLSADVEAIRLALAQQ